MKRIVLAGLAATLLSGCMQPYIIASTCTCEQNQPAVEVVRMPAATYYEQMVPRYRSAPNTATVNATAVVRRQVGFNPRNVDHLTGTR